MKKLKKLKNLIQGIECRLTHDIETIRDCIFVDEVSGLEVGEFICKDCNVNFMAYNKRSIHRVLIPDELHLDKINHKS